MNKLQERYADQPIKWATIAGLVLLLVSLFGPWAKLDLGELGGLIPDISTDGFDHNGTLMLLLAVVGLAGIGVYSFADINLQPMVLLWVLVGIALANDLLVLLAFFDISGNDGITLGWGLLLAVVAAIVTSVGAIVPMWGEIRSRAGEMRGSTS